MTELLTEIPRWVTNLAFWVALLALLVCAWGVHRSFKGSRAQLDKALDEVYDALTALRDEQTMAARPLSAPLSASDNVRDIPTTRTAVARTDEAVEGLKATLGMPTDPTKLTVQPSADTAELRVPYIDDTATRIGESIPAAGWSYVLSPDHKLEIVDGQTVPAFRGPDDTPTPEQLESPTNPDLQAVPGRGLAGATRLIPIGGRHRHPEDTE